MHGYHAIPRGRFLLLKEGTLSKEAFLLYEASLSFADWDKDHTETYGSLDLNQKELEHLLSAPQGFVSRYGKQLREKGFWEEREDRKIQVIGFELIHIKLLTEIAKKEKVVNIQKYIAGLQNGLAQSQELLAKKQTNYSKENSSNQPQILANKQTNPSISDLVSSKDSVEIASEKGSFSQGSFGDFTRLTQDDFDWINENVKEGYN